MYGAAELFYIVLTSLCVGLKVSPTQILGSVVLGVYEVIRVTKIWLILVVEPFVYLMYTCIASTETYLYVI